MESGDLTRGTTSISFEHGPEHQRCLMSRESRRQNASGGP